MSISSSSIPLPPSFRRQQLLLDFASLKYRCPDGIYLTPNTNDPSTWTGVYFVREGPYSSAILRFELLFPSAYPESAPFVIFSTEIFHPLLVPLTTYTFSPGATDPNSTYSASDTDHLPPGALSLKYGFPQWFPTADRGRSIVREEHIRNLTQDHRSEEATEELQVIENLIPDVVTPLRSEPTTIRILNYIKSAFESPQMLDALPLDAVGNPNAWHAWRSHRGLPLRKDLAKSPTTPTSVRTGALPRSPADWNWDGVWEARVRDGIEESASDSLLFSNKNIRSGVTGGDVIRFTKTEDANLASIQGDMLKMHGFGEL